MPYITQTRLLLQFEDSPDYDGDTSEWQRACTLSTDTSIYLNTSPHGSGTGHCLFCDGPNGMGRVGKVSVDSPSTLLADGSSVLISFHYQVDAAQNYSSNPLGEFYVSYNYHVRLFSEPDGALTITGRNNGTFFSSQSTANAANEPGTGWHHVYIYVSGTDYKVGLDGSQVITGSQTNDIFGLTYPQPFSIFQFGAADSNYWTHHGFLDSIQVFENSLIWYGGSYTVPGKPINYLPPGTPVNVDLTGQDLTFAQGAFGVGLPVNVSVAGQVISFSTPTLRSSASPSNKRLWSRQPTKRLRADMLQPLTGGRIGAHEIAREFWETPSSNISAALTGQALPFSQGAVAASSDGPVNISLSGQSFSMAQGLPSAARSIIVSGQSYSFSFGAIAANQSIALTGTEVSYQQGAVVAGIDREVAITGQSYSYSQGAVTASQEATYNSNTRLQMRFNEANGSTTTDDSSPYGHDSSTFYGPSEISTAEKKFGQSSLALGNPGGTKTAGDVYVSNPAGIFTTSTSSAKRVDFWYKRVGGATQSNAMLFSIKLQNDDVFGIYTSYNTLTAYYAEAYGGESTVASGTYTNPFPYSAWNHFRVLINGNTITVACNGVEIDSTVRTGGTDIWRASDVSEFTIGNWHQASPDHDNLTYAPWGWMDSLVVTDGDSSWTGGSYSVPTAEPADPPTGGGISGEGANTADAVTSTGSGILGRMASGENTVDAVTSTGVGVVEKFMVGASTVDAVTTEGVLAKGVVLYAEGANTLEATGNVGTAIMQPTRFLSGANTVEAVTSTGAGYIWANLVGANTTAPVTSTGTGDNTSPLQEIFGEGANTTAAVTSTGSGEAPIVGAGANTTAAVLSVGELFTGAILSGSNTIDPVASLGTGFVGIRVAQGANTTDGITSAGAGVLAIYGLGASDVSVSSIGYAELAIQGSGNNALDDVKTYFPDGYFDHYDVAFTKTQENRVWVR